MSDKNFYFFVIFEICTYGCIKDCFKGLSYTKYNSSEKGNETFDKHSNEENKESKLELIKQGEKKYHANEQKKLKQYKESAQERRKNWEIFYQEYTKHHEYTKAFKQNEFDDRFVRLEKRVKELQPPIILFTTQFHSTDMSNIPEILETMYGPYTQKKLNINARGISTGSEDIDINNICFGIFSSDPGTNGKPMIKLKFDINESDVVIFKQRDFNFSINPRSDPTLTSKVIINSEISIEFASSLNKIAFCSLRLNECDRVDYEIAEKIEAIISNKIGVDKGSNDCFKFFTNYLKQHVFFFILKENVIVAFSYLHHCKTIFIDDKNIHQSFILLFFKFLNNIISIDTTFDVEKYKEEVYNTILQLNDEKFVAFLKELGKKFLQTAEIDFFQEYLIKMDNIESFNFGQRVYKMDDIIDELKKGITTSFDSLISKIKTLKRSKRFMYYLISKVENKQIKMHIYESIVKD